MSIEGFGRIPRTRRLWAPVPALDARYSRSSRSGSRHSNPPLITGHVTNAAGAPLSGAQVTIQQFGDRRDDARRRRLHHPRAGGADPDRAGRRSPPA